VIIHWVKSPNSYPEGTEKVWVNLIWADSPGVDLVIHTVLLITCALVSQDYGIRLFKIITLKSQKVNWNCNINRDVSKTAGCGRRWWRTPRDSFMHTDYVALCISIFRFRAQSQQALLLASVVYVVTQLTHLEIWRDKMTSLESCSLSILWFPRTPFLYRFG
jgi:hypothetical protein